MAPMRRFTVCAGLDAGKVESWGGVDERPCYVIMLEVLDNLPHDRVCNTSDGWMQTRVVPSSDTVGVRRGQNTVARNRAKRFSFKPQCGVTCAGGGFVGT